MTTYPVAGPDLLEPLWFSRARSGQHSAVIAEGGDIVLDGVALRLPGETLPPGTAVKVWLNGAGFFVCATIDEIEREALVRHEADAAVAEQRRQQLNALRADAEAFNARIVLPIKWDVGIKDVLSGLSESSWGDGRNKATVEHIYLLASLQAGRLLRKEGDFLCTSADSTNGKRWSTKVVDRRHDGDGHPYQPKVTCKACLALVGRWI